ncbi:MAG: histidine kinase [Bacteroidota bacterium]|nr:histidine kinase [Bacteroidota bacterium]
MEHPVFKSIKSIIFFFGTWFAISVIHFSILFFLYHLDFGYAIADSICFNSLFCILSIAIWFVLRYSRPGKATIFNIILNNLTVSAILLFIWFGLGYSILTGLIFHNSEAYLQFIDGSIPQRIISGFFLYMIFAILYYLYIYNQELQDKMVNEAKLNEMVKDSELNLLKSQINPHFLFNSLNSVSSLTVSDPEKARDMVVKLSDFLRYTVSSGDHKFVSFDQEIKNAIRYLEIEKVRFENKLETRFDIEPSCLEEPIPVMILQPLYENAVKHGVYESSSPVQILTIAKMHEKYWEINISNNFEPNVPSKKGTGIGLMNIRERLRLIYHSEQLLKTEVREGIFIATITIPRGVRVDYRNNLNP